MTENAYSSIAYTLVCLLLEVYCLHINVGDILEEMKGGGKRNMKRKTKAELVEEGELIV